MSSSNSILSDFERDQMRILELNRLALEQKSRLEKIKSRQAKQIAAAEILLSDREQSPDTFAPSDLKAG